MSDSLFYVLMVGAGEVNFGSIEGPWNHSVRLERELGARLRVLGVVDPDVKRSEAQIAAKHLHATSGGADGTLTAAWSSAVSYASLEAAASALSTASIDLIVLGAPPHFRGTMLPGKDLELQVIRLLPHARGLLVEKPVAASPPEEGRCGEVHDALREWSNKTGAVVGVGYMLRYLRAVQEIKHILSTHSLTPMLLNARYYMAYEHAVKPAWWDKAISCGPVVEQATHFVDLLRYLGDSEVREGSVSTRTVEHDDAPGRLAKIGFDEQATVSAERRVPRVTTSHWTFENGAAGTLCHVVGLHGTTYDTELEVVADGWVLRLKDAYSTAPMLVIRRPGAAEEETMTFEDDDCYQTQITAFVRAIDARRKEASITGVLSSFGDALRTYELTWEIRRRGEEERARRLRTL